ncbi:MAG TPA: fibronectin type III domain-containing protein [Candidatus Dormibacteraeota bacterium]|nr:fibronectin type III domain-containing protein [Candidatus Dormibacteraeota bacterium]
MARLSSSQAQTSVNLAWSAVTNATGYHIYQGTISKGYTSTITVPGNSTQATVSGLTAGTTYYAVIAAYNANGESAWSPELVFTTSAVTNNRPPPSGLTFAATNGTITAPFISTNGAIYQNVQTGVANGGEAIYPFTLANAGNYVVSAVVNAPDGSANSFYVNIDAEPVDPFMMWSIPITSGFTNQVVSWAGTSLAGPPQFSPKIFTLAAGAHNLIIRGREANAQLQSLSIAPAGATLQLTKMPGNVYLLTGVAPVGNIYDVQATRDFKTWTKIGSVTADASGAISLVDPAASGLSSRFYRLLQTSP